MPSVWSHHTPCNDITGNPMVRYFISYFIKKLGVHEIKAPTTKQHVLFLDRRDYSGRRVERQIALSSLSIIQNNLQQHEIEFEVWNPYGTTVQEQIRKIRSTNVILGVHGAGLTHMVFQDDAHTGVVELAPSYHTRRNERSTPNIYPNLAVWMARPYRVVRMPHDNDILSNETIQEISSVVVELLNEIKNKTSY
jgi:capsular polysaccharide biosynthesis protein